ncbi:SpaH/EbpB family LPXTG-anchored major pilin [Corynebacterium sp. 13CS0277]|uniref:SpaH/EbpB family LPXTG-anchored major pilin n=1 Tax=Corynebacterium sp. 13CS0277 TaxID=2071994 RepID=UPI001304C194|nr:SpaH/EbpB family LPXTG-anchored major pilin [Corynebacterium sp. 13CS0277]
MTRKSMGRATTAGLSIAAVAGLGFAATPLAFAQDGATTAPAAPAACEAGTQTDFDATKDVDFTLHKKLKNDGGTVDNNGKKLDSEDGLGEALEGVTFSVQRVEAVDYAGDMNKAQQEAARLTEEYKKNEDAAALGTLGAAVDMVTGADGVVSQKFKPGLYLVTESNTPEGVTPSKPFLVNLPLTDQTNRACWNYDVHVYPKNFKVEKPELNKTVKDVTAPGSNSENNHYTYEVSSKFKAAANGWAKFQLIDPLSDKLTYVGDEAGDKADKVTLNGTELVKDTDYEIIKAEKDGLTWVTIGLTKAGLEKMGTAEGEVVWTINVEAKDTEGLTDIYNIASNIAVPKVPEGTPPTDPNYPPDPENPNTPDPKNPFDPKNPPETPDPKKPTPPGEPTPSVDTYYNKLVFTKVGTPRGETEEQKLPGAKFEVYECDADMQPTGEWAGKPVGVDNKKVFESDANGVVTIDGLLVNDFRNNSTFVNGTDGDLWKDKSFYCLKEIEAPEGFELLPAQVKFQVLKNGNVIFNGGEEKLPTADLTLKNQPKNNGFNLPLTGGAGIAPLVVVGGLLIAGSGAYVAAASRRKKQA